MVVVVSAHLLRFLFPLHALSRPFFMFVKCLHQSSRCLLYRKESSRVLDTKRHCKCININRDNYQLLPQPRLSRKTFDARTQDNWQTQWDTPLKGSETHALIPNLVRTSDLGQLDCTERLMTMRSTKLRQMRGTKASAAGEGIQTNGRRRNRRLCYEL